MKKFSKILSVALLVALVLSFGTMAFADDGTTDPVPAADPAGRTNGAPLTNKHITLTNPSAGHTYVLYQVFTGTFAQVDGADTLGNLAWGSGVTEAGKTTLGTATEVAKNITNTAAGAQSFAISIDQYLTGGTTLTAAAENPTALTWENLSEGYYIIKDTTTLANGESADAVVVQVLDNVEIKAKAGTTEFDKKVRDRNDSTQAPTVYDEWGNTSDYDVGDDVPYQLTITLPANFSSYETYKMTVKDNMGAGLIFNNDVAVTVGETTVPATAYSVVTTGLAEGETFEIQFDDVKAITGAADGAVFTITYSAKLSGDGVVYGNPGNPNEAWLTYSNNPTTDSTGDTPHKTTVTFTYKFEIDKVDSEKNPLTGAEFTLEKLVKGETDTWTTLALIKNDAGTTFTFDGLDDGLYRITETVTPAGYNSINPIYFTVVAEHSDTLTSLVVKQSDETGKALDTDKATAAFTATLTKAEDGKDAGLIDTTIVNNSGSVLPSTGGIGTTIFYVVGGVLVLAAIILLVTKKRMSE